MSTEDSHALELRTSGREWLKDGVRLRVDFSRTQQALGFPCPPVERPAPEHARRCPLPPPEKLSRYGKLSVFKAILNRKSRRQYGEQPFSLKELSYLLWATQGLRSDLPGMNCFRTVPSAGARHAFESYVAVERVEGLAAGLYRYLPVHHELVEEFRIDTPAAQIADACYGQGFIADAAVVFVWVAVPARMEWRYGAASYKVMALDAGHIAQNLYLACECLQAGTCAVAAYDQEAMDRLLQVDGEEEFVLYLAPVGKLP